ncbi:MAG: hypothetical protein IJ192_14200 [Clostridia bacterium]|nr:hypothetical protein [Clostridia bacterium]
MCIQVSPVFICMKGSENKSDDFGGQKQVRAAKSVINTAEKEYRTLSKNFMCRLSHKHDN